MITRFLTWLSQTLCGWGTHDYIHVGDGHFECIHCGKEMPYDEF